MNKVIDRIAAYYSNWNVITMLDVMAFDYWQISNNYPVQEIYDYKECRNQLSSQTLRKIESNHDSPRLDLKEINAIVKDYPFQLPTELLDLYQRGNGCLPIGLDDSSKNWNSFDNYIDFSFIGNSSFLPLSQAMDMYQSLAEDKKYCPSIDLRWFPINCYEERILAIVGSEQQQETGAVISFYDVEYIPEAEWSSLTGMLSAFIEIRERELKHPEDESEIDIVYQKYGRQGNLEW